MYTNHVSCRYNKIYKIKVKIISQTFALLLVWQFKMEDTVMQRVLVKVQDLSKNESFIQLIKYGLIGLLGLVVDWLTISFGTASLTLRFTITWW